MGRPQLSEFTHGTVSDPYGRIESQSCNRVSSSQSHMESQAYFQTWLENLEENEGQSRFSAARTSGLEPKRNQRRSKKKPKDDRSCRFQCWTWLMVTLILVLLLVPIAYYTYVIVKPLLNQEGAGQEEVYEIVEDDFEVILDSE